jgi:hypothetical protein
MFTDPVFSTLAEYKKTIGGDVIRFELIIRSEIARIDQYLKHAYLDFHKNALLDIRQERIDNLKETLALIPAYLDVCFREHLKSVPFWERSALKAQGPNWKYTFYVTERRNGAEEITTLLSEAAKTSVKQVKKMKEEEK